MNRQSISIESEQQWLQLRHADITSTEVAALFNLSPYITPYELFVRKCSNEVIKIQPNERMRWGNRLEAAIANGVAEDMKWAIRKSSDYIRLPDQRIGSSFDYWIDKSNHDGPGILEVKNVDSSAYSNHWIESGDHVEAPEHIELQVQHQLLVSGLEWAAIVALVGGNTTKIIVRPRDPRISQAILDKVGNFWDMVKKGQAPDIDYHRDSEFIIKELRNRANAGEVVNADQDLEQLILKYRGASAACAAAEQSRDALKAEILMRIGTASKVISTYGTLSCGVTDPSPGKMVTADMVGLHIGARAGFRQFRFNTKKVK